MIEIKQTFDKLVDERKQLENIWRDAYLYTYPHKGQYFVSNSNDGILNTVNAQNYQSKIFDSTASDSVSLLAASIMSGLTPSANRWFQFRLNDIKFDDLSYSARDWMETSAKTLFNMIHNNSNYNSVAIECLEELAISGMFAMYITKDQGEQFIFELWPLDTLYVQENYKTKVIDTVYRLHLLSASEAADNFGLENLPDSIQSAYNNNPNDTKKYEFIHCIKPRKDAKGKLSNQLPFGSYYVCKQSGKLVKESGYHEMPVVVPRWTKLPRTSYAVGPINKALPDIKTLNKVVEMMLMNEEMAIAGTYVAKADGYLNPNSIKIGARKVIFANDPKNIIPLASGGDFRIAFEEITRLQRQIKSVMMADELEPIAKNYASALEVQTRTQIVRQILAPIFARLQSEFLEILLTRCFNLALRDGSIPLPPEELQNMDLVPEYISSMARAQKMEEVTAMSQFEQAIGATAQLNPAILDVYDWDAAAIRKAQLLGVPTDIVRSKDQLRRIRDDRAKAEQAARQQATQQQVMTDPGMAKVGLEAVGGPEGLQQMFENVRQ